MRRLGFVLAVLLVMVPLGSASLTPYSDRVYRASWEHLLLPLPENDDSDCEEFDGCPEDIKGVAYDDHHVGPHIDGADEDPYYIFRSYGEAYGLTYNEVLAWELCMYDSQKDLIGCDQHEGEWYNTGRLDVDTEHVRVILRQGLDPNYSFDIWI